MKRIYTSRSLLTLLIFTVFSLFGGGNLLKAQIALTSETLTFEDFSNASSGSGYKSTSFVLPAGNVSYGNWTTKDCMKTSARLQLKASTGKLTSPTINSSAGYTVKVTYGSEQSLTLTIGEQTATGSTSTSATVMGASVELTTTSTSASFSIAAGSKYAVVSKIEIIPTASGKLSNPIFDLSAGEYVIGQQLGISAAAGANIVYAINGGEEVTVEDASASYRFPETGTFTVKAKAVPAAGMSSLSESDWAEADFVVKENIVTPVSGGELDIELWSEAFPSGFTAGSKYQLVAGGGKATYFVSGEQLAGGQDVGELLIRSSNGAFIVTLDDLKGVYGDIALTFKSNNGCTVSTTTSGCSVSDYTFNKPDASCIVSVPKGTTSLSLTFENTSSSNTRVDDFLLVGKVKETATAPYYPVTISASGISTFAAGQAYVMPEGLQGGIVTVNTEKNEANVTYLYEAGDVVPAREALLLKGTAGMPYSLELSEQEGTKIDDNLLRPALTYDAISADSGESFYIFANDATGGLGFYFQGADGDGSKVEGIYGKAYLAVSGTNPVRGFRLGEGDVTGIDRIESGVQAAGTSVYTLGGVRVAGSVESLPAGFYIVNGKKVLVK